MNTKKSLRVHMFATLAIILLAGPFLAVQASIPGQEQRPLNEKVRHELVMLPFYTVFDNIEYMVEGDTVTLQGQVTQPVLKYDAESTIKHIAGVSKVVNNIQVLPLSPIDNQIRRAEYRSIFSGSGTLSRYGWAPIPSIHIIVASGRVTLVGVVNNQTDKDMATLFANRVPGVFSVQNNLTVRNG